MIKSKKLPGRNPSNLFFRNPNHPAYRPRRKPVTIGIGFAYDDGLLLCADTKISAAMKAHETKLAHFVSKNGYFRIAFAMSGQDMNFPRAAIEQCWEFIRGIDFVTASMETVRRAVNESLAQFHCDHIYPHPDRTPGEPYLEFLVGMWLRDETRLYLSHETVLTPVERFECIGSGAYLAKYLIQQYLEANGNPTNLRDVNLIAKLAVKITSTYDQDCEAPQEMLLLKKDGSIEGPRPIDDDSEYKFTEGLSVLSWKLLHNLAHAQFGWGTTEELTKFGSEVQKLHVAGWWGKWKLTHGGS